MSPAKNRGDGEYNRDCNAALSEFIPGQSIVVQLSSEGAGGDVHADVVQLVPVQ